MLTPRVDKARADDPARLEQAGLVRSGTRAGMSTVTLDCHGPPPQH